MENNGLLFARPSTVVKVYNSIISNLVKNCLVFTILTTKMCTKWSLPWTILNYVELTGMKEVHTYSIKKLPCKYYLLILDL